MASIHIEMNNLTIDLSGVAGYMDECTYTNLDPIDYHFKFCARDQTLIYTCKANKTTPTEIEGWRRIKTDEAKVSFLGATLPA